MARRVAVSWRRLLLYGYFRTDPLLFSLSGFRINIDHRTAAAIFAKIASARAAFHSAKVDMAHPISTGETNPPALDAAFISPQAIPAALPPISTAIAQLTPSNRSPAPAARAIRTAAISLPGQNRPAVSSDAD